jgi:membrane fusion protein (multidrug efflux system)
METAKNDILVQQAASKQAQAQYDNAMTQLSYTNIVAPVSGRVGHRTVELGQQVERGQALLSIVSDEKWVMANFKETDLHGMRPGQPVDVKVDAIPDKVFHGKVESISPASGAQFSLLPPDNASGNFTKVVQRIPVKIVFDSESIKGYEDILAPGMSSEVEVHVK